MLIYTYLSLSCQSFGLSSKKMSRSTRSAELMQVTPAHAASVRNVQPTPVTEYLKGIEKVATQHQSPCGFLFYFLLSWVAFQHLEIGG